MADGYQFNAVYTADFLSNVSGGIETGSRYIDNLDLTLEVDIADAWGFGAGTLFVYGLYNNSGTFSDELVGDLQVVSNIDTGYAWRLYEFWYEFGVDTWSVRTGLYDLNSEFDVNEASSLFLNSSHGIGADFSQSGENGPGIFPVSALTLRGALQTDAFAARIAILDGVPGDPEDPGSNEIDLNGQDGVLTAAELEKPIAESARVWAGYWRYSGDFERPFGGGSVNNNDGWYVGAENRFGIGTRSVAWFVRYGQADERLNVVRNYLGAGIVIGAPIASRPDDRLGMAIASARVGNPYQTFINQSGANTQRRETTWEVTYRAQINEHLAIQPDMQLVQNPAASSAFVDAWVVGLRFEITY